MTTALSVAVATAHHAEPTARIPMSGGADSRDVAAASAAAFRQIRPGR